MALEIRKSSKWWYAAFTINGQKTVINLGVPITGKRPPKRTMLGDDEFERSRGRAQEAHDRQEKELTLDRNAESALRKLVEIKTGKPAGFPKLAELPKLWLEIPRRKTPGKHYVAQCTAILERFVAFVQDAKSGIKEFVEVTPEIAKAFMDAEQARGVSPSTWNYSLELLRTTFKRLHPQLPHGHNPFREFVTKAADTVSRVPFTPEELKAIQEACAQDDFIRPVIITGMCTAMRRGDCCCLKWSDVDLKERFISVKTSKTGEKVDIPIFPLLHEELEQAKVAGRQSAYCFPQAAEMYLRNADGISIRVKAVLARAFQQKEAGATSLAAPRPSRYPRPLDFKVGLRVTLRIPARRDSDATAPSHAARGTNSHQSSFWLKELASALESDAQSRLWMAVSIQPIASGRPPFHGICPVDITVALPPRSLRSKTS